MSETKRNKERVDQAWNKLYDRLDATESLENAVHKLKKQSR